MDTFKFAFGEIQISQPSLTHFAGMSAEEKTKIVFGRSPACDFRVNHSLVSGTHCEIIQSPSGAVMLTDTSVNGTHVNGKSIKKKSIELVSGDTVALVKHKNTHIHFTVKFSKTSSDETVVEDENIKSTATPPASKRVKLDDHPEPEKHQKLTDAVNSVLSEDKPTTSKTEATREKNDLGDILTCPICFDIISDCVSIQHCLHNFCNGCLGSWVKQSNNCPQCRIVIESVSRNHTLNNIIESYKSNHPDAKRSESELKELATKAVLQPGVNQIQLTNNTGQLSQSSYSSMSSSSSSSFISMTGRHANYWSGPFVPRSIGSFDTCRRCPTNISTNQQIPTQDSRVPPCQPGQTHLLCNCCYQLFPSIFNQAAASANSFVANCELCHQAYCGLMLKCPKPGCNGCLAMFRDMNFTDASLDKIINNNDYESSILKDYLLSQRKNWKNLLIECLDQLESGEFRAIDPVNSGTILCYRCGIKNFRHLAYQYRQKVPRDQLPPEVRNRSDCHWGRNCKTQTHKIEHARRFNHICEQTRDS